MSAETGLLAEYAARVLTGTGITAAAATAVASGASPDSSLAAYALRDGWQAATRAVDLANDQTAGAEP